MGEALVRAVLEQVQDGLHYRFNDIKLLEEAFTVEGICDITALKKGKEKKRSAADAFEVKRVNNHRLSLLGVSYLEKFATEFWFTEDGTPDQLSKFNSTILSNANLAVVAQSSALDLRQRLQDMVSEKQKSQIGEKTLATLIKAVVGAVIWDARASNVTAKKLIKLLGLQYPLAQTSKVKPTGKRLKTLNSKEDGIDTSMTEEL